MGHMGTRVSVMAATQAEADAWVTVLRAMGMDVNRPSDKLTHDGSWMVRARTAQRGQRQDDLTCTRPNEAS